MLQLMMDARATEMMAQPFIFFVDDFDLGLHSNVRIYPPSYRSTRYPTMRRHPQTNVLDRMSANLHPPAEYARVVAGSSYTYHKYFYYDPNKFDPSSGISTKRSPSIS